MGRLFLCTLLFMLAGIGSPPALADTRVALVIGNTDYRHVAKLANPANDANLLADTLRSIGFTLVGGRAQLDLDKPALEKVIQEFGDRLADADVGCSITPGMASRCVAPIISFRSMQT